MDTEAEQQKNLEAWILKQEENDEQLYKHIQKVKEDMASQQEKMESDKIEQRSTLESLIGRFQNFKIDLKKSLNIRKSSDSDDELASLSSDFGDEANLKSEIASLKLEQKKMMEEIESFEKEVQLKVENVLEADQLAHEAMINFMRNEHKGAIALLEIAHQKEMKNFEEDIFNLKQSLQVLKNELNSVKNEKKVKVEEMESFEKRLVHQFCSMKIEQNGQKQGIEWFREEMISMMNEALEQQKLDYELKLNCMETEQKKMMEVVKAENKHEIESFRGEIVSKLDQISRNTKIEAVKFQVVSKMDEIQKKHNVPVAEEKQSDQGSESSTSNHEPEKMIEKAASNEDIEFGAKKSQYLGPIHEAIIGDWKLVNLSYRNDSHKTNENNNERIDLIRFQIFENTLISYFFDGHGFRELRREFRGTEKCRANHWRIEADRIESVHFHGCPSNTRKTEYSTRYIEHGQLVVINEMGGCVCTKFYEKV